MNRQNKKAKLVSLLNKKRSPLSELIPLKTPFVIYVEPSGFCNLKCRFCPQGSGTTHKKAIMPIDLFKKLVNDVFQFKDKIQLLRICGNSDPLINKQIVEIAKLAREKKLFARIELVTNGTLLNGYLINSLPLYLNRIIISLDGLSADDYLRISNNKINFEKLLANISQLHVYRKKCKIHIKINNQAVLSKTRKTKFLHLFRNISDEVSIENLVPMWPQYKTDFSTNEFRYEGKVVPRKVCVQIFKGLQVQANGDVVPCCVDWNRTNLLGNIKKNSLLSIWTGKKLRVLRIKHLKGKKPELKTCQDCTMNDYCDTDNIDKYKNECLNRLLSE